VSDRADDEDRFQWQFGDTFVTVNWEHPSWVVRLNATSRLAGPGALVSKRDYQQAAHAAYAVMTHVQRITMSEETGVEQGRAAARWIRQKSASVKTAKS
jgi:hypothetical protein